MKSKIKHTLFGIGASIIVLAPISTIVACGSNNKHEGKAISLVGIGETQFDVRDKEFIDNISKTLITPEVLKKEAIEIKDDSIWSNGIHVESVSQSLSFLRAIATEFGYDFQKDFVDKRGYPTIFIKAKDIPNTEDLSSITNDANKQRDLKVLREFKSTSLKHPYDKRDQIAKFKDNVDGDQTKFVGLTFDNTKLGQKGKNHSGFWMEDRSDIHLENLDDSNELEWSGYWKLRGESHKTEEFTRLTEGSFAYVDPSNPGTLISNFMSTNGVITEYSSENAIQKYPVIESSKFNKDYVPYLKAMIMKLTQSYAESKSDISLASKFITTDFKTMVDFLYNKFTTKDGGKTTFKFDEEKFNQVVNKLNNGSHHLLAIKSFVIGFDKSFTQEFPDLSISGGAVGRWNKDGDLKGLLNMGKINGVTSWVYSTNNDAPFIATKNREQQKAAMIDLIMTDPLMNGFETKDKTFEEVRNELYSRIDKSNLEKFKKDFETQLKNAGINTDNKSLDDLRFELAKK